MKSLKKYLNTSHERIRKKKSLEVLQFLMRQDIYNKKIPTDLSAFFSYVGLKPVIINV